MSELATARRTPAPEQEQVPELAEPTRDEGGGQDDEPAGEKTRAKRGK